MLTAVAVNSCGVSATSPPVRIGVAIGIPPFFEYEITSPTDGDILLPGEPFIYSVAAMAQPSARDDYENPVSLLMGTNVLATFYRAAPYAILVTNPPAGSYVLTLALDRFSHVQPVNIRVAPLALRPPRLDQGRITFDAVTAFPTKRTIIEASSDLRGWTPISTNIPSINSFQFTDSNPPAGTGRFYRIVVPPSVMESNAASERGFYRGW
jgi:hypothetical protein